MGVNFSDSFTSAGKEFQKMLKELDDLEVRVGFQKGDDINEDGVDICDIAAWNELGTDRGIPSRPFLRGSVDNHQGEINQLFKKAQSDLLQGQSVQEVLSTMGNYQVGVIQKEIISGSFKENAQSTIARKKSSRPLIDTGRMRQSVHFVIKKKGEGGD